ncbi:MAG: DUF5946 family protein [Pseudomonadota bacterium]
MGPVTICDGCKGRFAEIDGRGHDYLAASARCWARFGQALALHYSDHRYWPAHQLLTDAYVLQHSLCDDPHGRRSLHVHLAALYAQLRLGKAEAHVIVLRRALSEFDFGPLPRALPVPIRSIASVDLSAPATHLSTVRGYAGSVLEDWAGFHDLAERLCRI